MISLEISKRVELVREELRREHLGAYIFNTGDPHNSEYVADRWKGREWISGFNGSAGTAVVTLERAALWTDSRYFIAAEQQLKGTEYQLMKLKMEGTPTIAEWLGQELADCDSKEVGADGNTHSVAAVTELRESLRQAGGLTLRTNLDILQRVWTDRPAMPMNALELQPIEFAGETTERKLARIRQALLARHADAEPARQRRTLLPGIHQPSADRQSRGNAVCRRAESDAGRQGLPGQPARRRRAIRKGRRSPAEVGRMEHTH